MEGFMDIGLKIKIISELMLKSINNEIRTDKIDITFQQMNVLRYLSENPGRTASLKEMEKNFGTAQATMAGLVVRLEEKGLVNTFHQEEDRRIKMVRLSEKGWKVLSERYQIKKKTEQKFISDLKPEEVVELNRLLDKLYGTVSRMADENVLDK